MNSEYMHLCIDIITHLYHNKYGFMDNNNCITNVKIVLLPITH